MSKFYFTFGCGIDEPNRNCYTVIEADSFEEAREIMIQRFGLKWAFQYDENGWMIDPMKDPNFKMKARFYGVDPNRKEPISQAELFNLKEIR